MQGFTKNIEYDKTSKRVRLTSLLVWLPSFTKIS